MKYTSFNRYHVTHSVDKDNQEHWNLEIRQIHLSDEGHYSCILTAIKPISKVFYVRVIGKYIFVQDKCIGVWVCSKFEFY